MTRTRELLVIAAVAVAAGAAGYGVHLWRLTGTVEQEAARILLASRLADLEGQARTLDEWRGKVLIVNYWATWCAPCREEIPVFIRLQRKYGDRGLQFIGIAIDRAEAVAAFSREFGMNYPVLIGGADAIEISRRAGNRVGALPFTVILDRSGVIVARELGGLKESRLSELIQPLL